jgi:ABC-type phosphate transport system permease subunit
VPIALFTSVFMARYCPKKIYRPLKSGIELMAGVPSIVYGFFGLMLSSNFLPTVKIECTQQQQQVKVAVQQPTGQLVQVLELKLAETAIGKPKIHDLTAQSKTQ